MNPVWLTPAHLDIFDSMRVRTDVTGRSVGFFCSHLPAVVGSDTIESLKAAASRYPDKNVRLCLHASPADNFHSMIIFERRGTYYPPHYHEAKDESWHVIEGEIGLFLFAVDGTLVEAHRLDSKKRFICRIEKQTIHTLFPLTGHAIYHESKPGPFLGENDSIVPSWAPLREDAASRDELVRRLEAALPLPNQP